MTSLDRFRRRLGTATLLPALLFLSACAASPIPPGRSMPLSRSMSSSQSAVHHSISSIGGFHSRNLYVAQISPTSQIDILRNKTYSEAGTITSGINHPLAIDVDRKGRIYVANDGGSSGGSIEEFAPNNLTSPVFVYTEGVFEPTGVAVDAHGTVYEAGNTNIEEFYQGSNTPIVQCQVSANAEVFGIAVDSSGDVFSTVMEFGTTGVRTAIVEFFGGLGYGRSACQSVVVVDIVPGYGYGIVLDKNQNLLMAAADQIDILKPPYTSVSGTIGSGFQGAFDVHINKKNDLVFVTDNLSATVTVFSYPSGGTVTVLGTGNGIGRPFAAVDAPDAVY
jgi:hypothetical protein